MNLSKMFSIAIAIITLAFVPKEMQPYILIPLIAYHLSKNSFKMIYSKKNGLFYRVVPHDKVEKRALKDEQVLLGYSLAGKLGEGISILSNVLMLFYLLYVITALHLPNPATIAISVVIGTAMLPLIMHNLSALERIKSHQGINDFEAFGRIKEGTFEAKRKNIFLLGITLLEIESEGKQMKVYCNNNEYEKIRKSGLVQVLKY